MLPAATAAGAPRISEDAITGTPNLVNPNRSVIVTTPLAFEGVVRFAFSFKPPRQSDH